MSNRAQTKPCVLGQQLLKVRELEFLSLDIDLPHLDDQTMLLSHLIPRANVGCNWGERQTDTEPRDPRSLKGRGVTLVVSVSDDDLLSRLAGWANGAGKVGDDHGGAGATEDLADLTRIEENLQGLVASVNPPDCLLAHLVARSLFERGNRGNEYPKR